jgi:GWxTD domain-containing protein
VVDKLLENLMNIRNILITAALIALAAVSSFAALSPSIAEWAKGPVQFLMTPDETKGWNALQSDADAESFVALFWARRDPNPATPNNEFREEFERRVKYADEHFANGRQRGSLTDRGKILILFGPPKRATRTRPTPANAPSPGTFATAPNDEAGETQIWFYEGDAAHKVFSLPVAEFHFVARLNSTDYRLEPTRFDLAGAQQWVTTGNITQPNLKTAPPAQAAAPPPQPVPAAPQAAPVNTLKTAALETVVVEAKSGKAPSAGGVVSYAEFVSPTGEGYVPVTLYVPASAKLTADSADTFFGVIEDATGKRVQAFEEPAQLTASKTDFFVDKTLTLPAGKYTATLGLAKAGVPALVTTAPIEVAGFTKDTAGTSKLLLSSNIYELPAAAPVKSPFAFGKLKIVPKADFVFTNKDELGYFVEIHNPGIDPTSNLPKLQMKIDLVDSKGKSIGSPLADAQALPLSGQAGPGEYAIVNAIPLAEMTKPLAPGDYTLKMKIIDTVTKQSYSLEQKLKITA